MPNWAALFGKTRVPKDLPYNPESLDSVLAYLKANPVGKELSSLANDLRGSSLYRATLGKVAAETPKIDSSLLAAHRKQALQELLTEGRPAVANPTVKPTNWNGIVGTAGATTAGIGLADMLTPDSAEAFDPSKFLSKGLPIPKANTSQDVLSSPKLRDMLKKWSPKGLYEDRIREPIKDGPQAPLEAIQRRNNFNAKHNLSPLSDEELKALAKYGHETSQDYDSLERLMSAENFKKVKKWAGIPALAASMLGLSQDEASAMPMAPEIRAMYKAALAKLGPDAKPLYHYSKDVESLIKNPQIGGKAFGSGAIQNIPIELKGHESWKPPAIYASDNLADNLVSRVGDWGNLRSLVSEAKRQKGTGEGIVRIVPKPNAKTKDLSEVELIQNKEDRGIPFSKQWGKNDLIRLEDVDGEPGLTEYLIRNPKAVSIFSDRGVWNPTVAGAGTIAGLMALGSEANAMPRVNPKLVKELYGTTSSGLLKLAGANKPLDVYHGSPFTFKNHAPDLLGMNTKAPSAKQGHFFTSSKDTARAYTEFDEEGGPSPSKIMRLLTKQDKAEISAESQAKFKTSLEHLLNLGAPEELTKLRGNKLNYWSPEFRALDINAQSSDPLNYGMWKEADPVIYDLIRRIHEFGQANPKNLAAVKQAWRDGFDFSGTPNKLYRRALDRYAESLGATNQPSLRVANLRVRDPLVWDMEGQKRDKTYAQIMKIASKEGRDATIIKNTFDGAEATDIFAVPRHEQEVLKRVLTGKDIWKAGITTSVLGFNPDSSEASPLGKWGKASSKLDLMRRSEDAFYRLVGHKLEIPTRDNVGKLPVEVVDVVRNKKKDEFYVVVKESDGTRHQLPMTKDYLHALTSAKGTKDYLAKLPLQSNLENKFQTLKSLGIREAKKENQFTDVSDSLYQQFNESGLRKVQEIDPALVHDYVYVRNEAGEQIYMPKAYAKILVPKGYVKYVKEPKAKVTKKRNTISDEELTRRLNSAYGKPDLKALKRGAGYED